MYNVRLSLLRSRKLVKSYSVRRCDSCDAVIELGDLYIRCGPRALCIRCYISRYPEERQLILHVLREKYPEAYARTCSKYPELCSDNNEV